MKPLLSTSADLGINTVLLVANCAGIAPPSSTDLYTLKNEPNPPAHLQRLYGMPLGPGPDSFFGGLKFIKLASVNWPPYIIERRRDAPQNCFVTVVPLTLNARFKDLTPVVAQSHGRFILIFRRVTIFVSNCVETQHRLLGTPGHVCISPERCLSPSVSKEICALPLLVQQFLLA